MPASYFLLRVEHPAGGMTSFSGAIERLSTGEKLRFRTSQELLELIGDWSMLNSKMLPREPGGKTASLDGTTADPLPRSHRNTP